MPVMEQSFTVSGARFEPLSLADSGQIFRAWRRADGSVVFLSGDQIAIVAEEGENYRVYAEDPAYFRVFFDEGTDYEGICSRAAASGVPLLSAAAGYAPGMRVLRARPFEAVFSFIVSQNNRVGRIRDILNRISDAYGARKSAMGTEYRAFPRPEDLPCDPAPYARLGAGYRAEYLAAFVRAVREGWDVDMADCPPAEIRARLRSLAGVGPKVADCAALYGYHLTECFPVDTWIYKAYREMGGAAASPAKAAEELSARFGADSGYFQQYLFYYKRRSGAKD